MAGDNQRAHDRIPFAGLVMFRNPPGVNGTGIDLSNGGMSVQTAVPLSEGSAVELDLGDGTPVSGTVRRSVPHPTSGFQLGIKWQVENGHLVRKLTVATA